MKGLLILFNLFLASMLVWGLASHFKPAASKTVYTVKKRTASQKKEVVAPVKPVAVQKKMTPKEQLAKIIEANIFNSDRCPNATAGGRNARVELSLVGTFKIGDCVGAIIKQKTSGNNNNNRFMPFMPGMPGGFPPGRQMGISRNNRPQNNGGRTGGTPGSTGMPGGMMFRSARNMRNGGMERGVRGQMPAIGTNVTAAAAGNQMTYTQYVRLGETLSNGYKLVEVNRDSVLLTRGSDKLELELLDASKNTPQTAGRTNRRVNTGTQMLQTLQNMQRMQMFQNMQMMRMMRQNQNPPQQQNNSSNMRSNTNRSRGRTR